MEGPTNDSYYKTIDMTLRIITEGFQVMLIGYVKKFKSMMDIMKDGLCVEMNYNDPVNMDQLQKK